MPPTAKGGTANDGGPEGATPPPPPPRAPAGWRETAGNTESEIKEIRSGTKFWEQDNVMNAKQADGEPYVERRQGLVDRSKTIWALVNPNDYEYVAQ